MGKPSIQGYENQYKLYRRFLALNDSIMTLSESLKNVGFIRYKPLFAHYNSCLDEFKKQYAKEHEMLGLEELKLFGKDGEMLFRADKLSTLLHQTKSIIGFLEGELLPEFVAKRERSTIVNVSSYADSQSASQSVAKVQAEITLNSLYQVIENSGIGEEQKSELLDELKELKKEKNPDQSRLKSFSVKLFKKLIEVGENVASEVIYKLLSSKMGEM